MKKTIFAGAFCLSILASSVGGYKFYTNQNTNLVASNLLSEDVEALSSGDSWASIGTVCKSIAGVWSCIANIFDSEPQEYSYLAITSHQCKKANGQWGNQDICANKKTTAKNPQDECVAGWSTSCN